MHKKTKITPLCRMEIYELWKQGWKITVLARVFRVTRPIIYKILKRAVWEGDFSVHTSINKRFKEISYGLRRLSKIEQKVHKQRVKKKAQRYKKAIYNVANDPPTRKNK